MVMFRAACKAAGCTEEEAVLISDGGAEQYDDVAEPFVNFINEHPDAALGVARFLLERDKVSALFEENFS